MATPTIEQKDQTRKSVEKTFDLAQLDDLLLFNDEEEEDESDYGWFITNEAANTWVDAVNTQRDVIQQNAEFNVLRFGQDVLHAETRVNCAAFYNNDQTILYGTNDGVYFQPQNRHSRKAIDLRKVRNIGVLEEHSLLIVLAEQSVFVFPLDTLEIDDPMKHMKRIATHMSFFQIGKRLGQTMVCTVKASPLSSTIKALEVIEPLPKRNQRSQTSWSDEDKLKAFKECSLATELYSVQFLKTKLCVAAANGFQVIDLETLDTHFLLDPEDPNLKFARRIEPYPLSVYRVGGEFLICYTEFAFYVNDSGKKSEKNVVIYWEGTPTACALHYPHIVAFSPNFVEIRHIDDGSLVQIIHETNVRCLHFKGTPAEDLAYHISRQRENNILVSLSNKVTFLTPTSSRTD
ncbi:hypothetical protein OPQ81_007975 [Rhizoctonia solani]|nr:hypothetical protein OPQ81_007975 [Rhizoctonia solani]